MARGNRPSFQVDSRTRGATRKADQEMQRVERTWKRREERDRTECRGDLAFSRKIARWRRESARRNNWIKPPSRSREATRAQSQHAANLNLLSVVPSVVGVFGRPGPIGNRESLNGVCAPRVAISGDAFLLRLADDSPAFRSLFFSFSLQAIASSDGTNRFVSAGILSVLRSFSYCFLPHSLLSYFKQDLIK